MNLEFKIPLWKHQKEASDIAKSRDYYAFLFEVGTGKTCAAITTLRYKYAENKRLLPTLILCPIIVMENWKREILANSKIKPLQIITPQGPGKKRARIISEQTEDPNKIVIINYESLLIEPVYEEIKRWGPEVLVCDESHYLKEMRSKRTKKAIFIADRCRYRYIMTGTPVLNTPMDLFAQFRVMDGGEAFGKSYTVFRAEYFYDRNVHMPPMKYFPDWKIKKDSINQFNQILNSSGMIVKKADCLDLPPLIKKPIYVELSKEQKRVYEELKKDLITFLNDKACTAPLAITKSLRLQQIVSGFVMGEDMEGKSEVIDLKENPRAKVLEKLLVEYSEHHKLIIWAVFKNNYKTIREVCDKLKIPFVEVHGEIKTKDKFKNVDTFNQDPKCRVLIGHPNSGGVGINLVASSISIFYSRNFSLGQDIQAEARNYRGGSEIHESILRIDLIAKDTIDEVIQKALASKQAISDKLLKKSQHLL